jgi:hypothetical protein
MSGHFWPLALFLAGCAAFGVVIAMVAGWRWPLRRREIKRR